MLLWLDGGLSTATKTHTQQHKRDFRVFVARKNSQLGYVLRQCYTLNLRPILTLLWAYLYELSKLHA
jgi:hypothetical protein